jgi:DNA repair exonuclease SbcCD ATPase subunit
MATTNIGFSVTVESNDATKSIKELRSEIDQTTQAVQELGQQYGENSKEVEAAQKRLLQLQDLTNQKQEENNRRIDNAAKTITALSAAYGGVQGALELTGLAGEDTIKQLAKIQSALAIGDAVQNLAEFKDAISSTFGEFRNTAVKAFQAVKGAIGATGIGLLIVSLGLVAANFDKIKKAVLEFIPGLNQVGQIFTSIVQKVTDFVGITSEAERALSSLEKTTKRGNESIEARIKVLTAQGGKEKEIYALSKQQGENELNFLRQKLKSKEGLNEEELKKFRELKTQQAVLDAQEVKRKVDLAKDAASKSKEISDKLAEEEAARLEKQLNDEKKLTEDLLAEYDKRRGIANKAKILTQKELNALDAQEAEERRKKEQGIIDSLSKITNYTYQNILKDQQLKDDARKAELQADQALQDAKFQAASAGLNLLSSLAGENEKIANAIFVIDKALAIAKIVVDTQREISAYAANPTWSILPDGGAIIKAKYILAAKIRAGAGIAAIAATSIAKFKGGGSAGGLGGGGSAPSVSAGAPIAPPQPQAATTNLSNQTINAIGNQAVRAYVVENDVTSNQQRIAAIQQRARFG